MKLLYKLSLLIILSLNSNIYADNQHNKIAVIDINLILEKSIAAQKIRHQVEVISHKIQRMVDDETNNLKIYEIEINKQKDILNKKEFEQELLKFNKRVSVLQRQAQESKSRIEKSYSEAIGEVHEKILQLINQVSYDEDFDIVIPAPVIIYAKTRLNITDQIIERINIELDNVKLNYQE